MSFVCSVGHLPLVLIHRKYYGLKATLYITGGVFVSTVIAGGGVDLLFDALGLIPQVHAADAMLRVLFQWNYTPWLDFGALFLCGGFL